MKWIKKGNGWLDVSKIEKVELEIVKTLPDSKVREAKNELFKNSQRPLGLQEDRKVILDKYRNIITVVKVTTVSKETYSFDFSKQTHGDQWVSECQRMQDFIILDLPNQEQFYEYKHIEEDGSK